MLGFNIRLIAAAALVAGASAAGAAPLGIAAAYNEFILGNASQASSDVQGRVAVGGNLAVSGMSLGSGAGGGNTVIVGGDFSATNGSVSGNVIAGGNVTYSNPSVSGSVSANKAVVFGSGGMAPTSVTYGTAYVRPAWMTSPTQQGITAVPIDFSTEFSKLRALSQAQVKSSDPFGVIQWSQAYFDAGTATGVQAFNISASSLNQATGGYHIIAGANTTVIINVSGLTGELFNTGYDFAGGIGADHVIWNFYEATTLKFGGSVYGTVLAPNAAVTAQSGGFNGTLIAASFSGYGGGATGLELHNNYAFTGTLRDAGISYTPAGGGAVPEPGMLLLFGIGAVGMAMSRRPGQRSVMAA